VQLLVHPVFQELQLGLVQRAGLPLNRFCRLELRGVADGQLHVQDGGGQKGHDQRNGQDGQKRLGPEKFGGKMQVDGQIIAPESEGHQKGNGVQPLSGKQHMPDDADGRPHRALPFRDVGQ